jgi:DNA-binding transcriptional LysR family regulator
MLDLNDFRFFVEVVNRGGFSAAGRALQRPTSTISYRIQQLEKELRLSLLARSSRSVVMTQAGEEFYRHAVSMLERANEAEVIMRGRSKEPIGTVHYTVAIAVAQFAMPEMLLSFMSRFPKVELVQHVSDQQADIVSERYDLAIRAHSGSLPNSQLIQRPLADVPWHLLASPDYLDRVGPLDSPADLERCETMFMKRDMVDTELQLRHEADSAMVTSVGLRPRMLAVCMVTLMRAAAAGMGVVALPAYVARDEIRAGRLQRVLPDWVAEDSKITVLMPHRTGMTAAVRAFVDHIAASFPSAVRLDPVSVPCDDRVPSRPHRVHGSVGQYAVNDSA